jgi:hypothetical protein
MSHIGKAGCRSVVEVEKRSSEEKKARAIRIIAERDRPFCTVFPFMLLYSICF